MFKIGHQKAQAASELAVFGAILIFVLGSIVRSALGNNYAQNQNFKAMRMALLASWEGSKASETGPTNTSRNSASVLFVEDRLSPDMNKYGDTDRTPYTANGSGTFSFELLYPMDPNEVSSMLPIMDVYIDGQHFPFTTGSYVTGRKILPTMCTGSPTIPVNGSLTPNQCVQNQCWRNQYEWVGNNNGGTVIESQFQSIVPPTIWPVGPISTICKASSALAEDACVIFNQLSNDGEITVTTWQSISTTGKDISTTTGKVNSSIVSPSFISWYEAQFPTPANTDQGAQLGQIQSILLGNATRYKLFYGMSVNGAVASNGQPQFSITPPSCSSHPCKNNELSSDVPLTDYLGHPTTDDNNNSTNAGAAMQFDLQRLRVYSPTNNPTYVPSGASMRPYMAWQWYATPGTTANMIGLDVSNNQYPQWDIDGRLKTVTIYNISQDSSGAPIVDYEDPEGGDIDGSWDANSCTPKPGLQTDMQMYTFTKAGTFMLVKEGGMYNPETDQFVRSVNKRDNINLVERLIQLSNNTGRFCTVPTSSSLTHVCGSQSTDTGCANPNPVEKCVDTTGSTKQKTIPGCASQANLPYTCFDNASKILYVRSRIEDRRGRFWFTDASGQIQVK